MTTNDLAVVAQTVINGGYQVAGLMIGWLFGMWFWLVLILRFR